jgi:hypothetical protein
MNVSSFVWINLPFEFLALPYQLVTVCDDWICYYSQPFSGSSEEECHKIHSRSKESQSPKTLRPAEAPALTLFSQDSESMTPNLDSLKSMSKSEASENIALFCVVKMGALVSMA